MHQQKEKLISQAKTGFTIVELIIVIVVIALLATIVAVGYNQVTKSAVEASIKSDLHASAAQLAYILKEEGSYPINPGSEVLVNSDQNSIKYRGSDQTYCLEGTSPKAKESTFHLTEKNRLESGPCPIAWVQVTAGKDHSYPHTLALDSDGFAWGWGSNNYRAITQATTAQYTTPTKLTHGALSGKKIVQVSAGQTHSLALDDNGVVYGWGNNTNSELGDNTTTSRPTPIAIQGGALAGKNIVAISAGTTYSMALDSAGVVYAWGYNVDGRLGDGSTTTRRTPVAVTAGALSGKSVQKIIAGVEKSYAIDTAGLLYGWGYSIGNGVSGNQTTPALLNSGVLAGKKISTVNSSDSAAQVVTDDGLLFVNGVYYNAAGTQQNVNTFTSYTLGSISGANITITAGVPLGPNAAIDSAGFVHTWGNNNRGGLGVGSYVNNYTPDVLSPSSFTNKRIQSITSGQTRLIALTSDGSIFSWGDNTNGALGDGSTTIRLSPVPIMAPTRS